LAALLRANGKSLLLHQHFMLSNEVLEEVRFMAVFVTMFRKKITSLWLCSFCLGQGINNRF